MARGGSSAIRSPFELMRRVFEQMDQLFTGYGSWPSFGAWPELDVTRTLPRGVWAPQIEMREKDGKLVLRADLPGLSSNDVEVNIEDDVLTISGERRNESESEDGGTYRSERSYGRFERRIALPEGIDANAIEAKFDNGVLELSAPLPPKKESRGRRIDIKGGARELGTSASQKQH